MIPSAVASPCQTSFHCTPPSITPGMAVMVTSFTGAGCANCLGGACWASSGTAASAQKSVALNEDRKGDMLIVISRFAAGRPPEKREKSSAREAEKLPGGVPQGHNPYRVSSVTYSV